MVGIPRTLVILVSMMNLGLAIDVVQRDICIALVRNAYNNLFVVIMKCYPNVGSYGFVVEDNIVKLNYCRYLLLSFDLATFSFD